MIKRGISLIIIIIVTIILAGAIILYLTNETTGKFELPLKGYLTEGDKTYIKDNIPTLGTKINELSGSINAANLAWISSSDIGIKLSA